MRRILYTNSANFHETEIRVNSRNSRNPALHFEFFLLHSAFVPSRLCCDFLPQFPTPLLQQVIALHRPNAKTLGFLPKGAFEEYSRLRQIIVALDPSGDCVGYLLYRIARGRASIAHLCVADMARGKGVARLLVDRLKEETKSLEGIGLYCRRDYEANHIWSKLGFEAVHARTGRGKDLAELTFWWFSHGHKDLFSRVAELDPDRRQVVIDSNVFYDRCWRFSFGIRLLARDGIERGF